jgi:protein-tyrosine-phosphatase/DNA-binding transcriptional ArsR family regulator
MSVFANSFGLFQVLGHGLRWRLLENLVRSDRSVQDLALLLQEKQSLVSYHLARLLKHNIVFERRSIADRREIYYSLDIEKLQTLFLAAGESLHPALNPLGQEKFSELFEGLEVPVRVLFLCTQNSARSQMAEAILRNMGGDLIEAYSAGTQPSSIHPLAVLAMKKFNIDISGQKSKDMEEFLDQSFNFVITVCDRAKESCPIFPGDPYKIHWSFPDPSEATVTDQERARVYEDTAAELNRRIGYLLMMIKRSLGPNSGR